MAFNDTSQLVDENGRSIRCGAVQKLSMLDKIKQPQISQTHTFNEKVFTNLAQIKTTSQTRVGSDSYHHQMFSFCVCCFVQPSESRLTIPPSAELHQQALQQVRQQRRQRLGKCHHNIGLNGQSRTSSPHLRAGLRTSVFRMVSVFNDTIPPSRLKQSIANYIASQPSISEFLESVEVLTSRGSSQGRGPGAHSVAFACSIFLVYLRRTRVENFTFSCNL